MALIIALISGALMSIQGVFNTEVTDQTSIDNSRQLGKCLRTVAEQLDVEFIDAAQFIKPGKVDGVHLDEEGHAKMSELVYEMVHTMLS